MIKTFDPSAALDTSLASVTALAEKLVSLPSYVDELNDETQLTNFLFSLLNERLPNMKVYKQFIKGSKRYNLILKGAGTPRLLIMGHVDTVHPSEGWQTDPLKPTLYEGNLYGLGASDMKGSLAAFLWALLEEQNCVPLSDLMVLMYVDEEYDFQGMKSFVESDEAQGLLPELIVSLDGSLEVTTGCRGLIELHAVVKGCSAHAANPNHGINAITETVDALQDLKLRLEAYAGPALGPTTVNVAYMRGGVVRQDESGSNEWLREGNKIPDTAELIIEVRPATTDVDARLVAESLEYYLDKRGLILASMETRHDIPVWLPVTDEVVLRKVRNVYENADVAFELADIKFGGYIDAQMIAIKTGAPTVIIGAGGSNKHAANESVPVDGLEKAASVYRSILRETL